MRRTVVFAVALVLLFGIAGTVFAQDGAFEEEGWKKRFASPTYGVVLAPTEIEIPTSGASLEEEILVPGFEIRIFNGMNVAKRGGFYTGYEVGVQFLLYTGGDDYYLKSNWNEVTFGNTGNYRIESIFSGTIFLLSKYGYRIDLGTAAGGLSIGPQVGIGAQMGGGSVDIYNETNDVTESADTEMLFGPRLELSIEAAFRLGKNFRLMGLIGANVGPGLEWEGTIDGEMVPVQPDIRLGFALNY
jgi:formylmethanofuran dehydrogenase subunit C